ncbi:MAG: hypothetical protein R2734_08655 [Nocardioides sp.]
MLAASGAVDWLLFDWMMASPRRPRLRCRRDPPGQVDDAAMIAAAADASVRVQAFLTSALARPRPTR